MLGECVARAPCIKSAFRGRESVRKVIEELPVREFRI
jgi:hypothetical protein